MPQYHFYSGTQAGLGVLGWREEKKGQVKAFFIQLPAFSLPFSSVLVESACGMC